MQQVTGVCFDQPELESRTGRVRVDARAPQGISPGSSTRRLHAAQHALFLQSCGEQPHGFVTGVPLVQGSVEVSGPERTKPIWKWAHPQASRGSNRAALENRRSASPRRPWGDRRSVGGAASAAGGDRWNRCILASGIAGWISQAALGETRANPPRDWIGPSDLALGIRVGGDAPILRHCGALARHHRPRQRGVCR